MSTGRKLWKIIVAALLLVPLFVGALGANAAEAGTADVTLHKRVFQDTMPTYKNNTGEIMPDFGGTPLAGAGFTVYDVSDYYDTEIRKSGATPASVQDLIEIAHGDGTTTPFEVAAAEQLTADGTGETTFANLPLTKSVSGKTIDAAYLIIETSTPANPEITQKAVPMVIAMPILVPGTKNVNTHVHLYPKNVTLTDKQKEFVNEELYKVTIGEGEDAVIFNSVQIGDPLNYKINVNMPDISKLDSFKVIDEPGVGMDLADPNSLSLPGLTLGTDYTVDYDGTASGRGFVIDFKDTAAVRALAGKVLTITYTMTLTADAPIDTAINNQASIQVDGETTTEFTPPNPVFTHGKQFKKVNGQTGEELAGAKFKVKKADGKFAKFDANGKFDGWDVDGTEISSDADGMVRISGMRVGDYTLVETEAPDGYVLVDAEILFSIVKDGYANPQDIETVNNFRKGLLPSTGGSGIYAFLIIGAMMMGGAYIWFKRSKEQAEV